MFRPGTLAAGLAAAMLVSSMAYAANFQEGHIKNCATETCTLNFTGPGPGKTLRLQEVTCRLRTSARALVTLVDYFDSTHALFVPVAVQDDNARRNFVATTQAQFFTGGANMTVSAHLGTAIGSEFACTITGQTSP
jgi:hypothetical protein